MKTYKNLYEKVCSWENLVEAYEKARMGKSNIAKVSEFDKHWQFHLANLYRELRTKTYCQKPLKKFVLRDPKTRVICVSDFRDRIVHHALVNVLQPIFEPRFIYDSYASRKGKGTTNALKRFKLFLRRATKNGKKVIGTKNGDIVCGFVLKADVKKYFDSIDHQVLLNILRKRLNDDDLLWLVERILENYHSGTYGKGMPLGNWTSQFFANVYLNELDQYVKNVLKIKWYIRYVDDFVIIHQSKDVLKKYKAHIDSFLVTLNLELHPNKCSIHQVYRGVDILGFRVFPSHVLLRKRNVRLCWKRLSENLPSSENEVCNKEKIVSFLIGWSGYAQQANTRRLRESLVSRLENCCRV